MASQALTFSRLPHAIPSNRTAQEQYDVYIEKRQFDLAERVARDHDLGYELRRRAVKLLIAQLNSMGLTAAANEIEWDFFGKRPDTIQ